MHTTLNARTNGTFLGYKSGYKYVSEPYNSNMGRKKSKIETLIQKEIDSFPKGSIVPKRIHGTYYYYLQWYEDGKTKSRYLKNEEIQDLYDVYDKRDTLKKDLSALKLGETHNFFLMHQNIPVGEYSIKIKTGHFLRQERLIHPELLPVGVHVRNGFTDISQLNEWFSYRIVPESRDGIYQTLQGFDLPSPGGLAVLSRGLNLVDQYWIRRVDENVLYEDVNFFDHPFSDQIGDALLGKGLQGGDLHNPSSSTNGDLRKAWRAKGEKRYLLKAGSGFSSQESFNEAAASIILDLLGLPHAQYDVVFIDGLPFSRCENFITRETELIDAWHIMAAFKKRNDFSNYQHFLYCCERFDIKGAKEYLDRLLTFDYIIGNEDRHFGNFGALRDANTLKFIGMSPIYDNGSCLAFRSALSQIRPNREVPSKPFKKTHREQIKLVTGFEWLDKDALKKVPGILEEVYQPAIERGFMTAEHVDAIIEETKARIDELLAYINNKSK